MMKLSDESRRSTARPSKSRASGAAPIKQESHTVRSKSSSSKLSLLDSIDDAEAEFTDVLRKPTTDRANVAPSQRSRPSQSSKPLPQPQSQSQPPPTASKSRARIKSKESEPSQHSQTRKKRRVVPSSSVTEPHRLLRSTDDEPLPSLSLSPNDTHDEMVAKYVAFYRAVFDQEIQAVMDTYGPESSASESQKKVNKPFVDLLPRLCDTFIKELLAHLADMPMAVPPISSTPVIASPPQRPAQSQSANSMASLKTFWQDVVELAEAKLQEAKDSLQSLQSLLSAPATTHESKEVSVSDNEAGVDSSLIGLLPSLFDEGYAALSIDSQRLSEQLSSLKSALDQRQQWRTAVAKESRNMIFNNHSDSLNHSNSSVSAGERMSKDAQIKQLVREMTLPASSMLLPSTLPH